MKRSLTVLFALLAACSEPDAEPPHDPGVDPDPDEDTDPPDDPDPARLSTEDNGDGTFTTTVDATSSSEWVLLSLSTGEQVGVGDLSDDDWDLAFRRSEVAINGGVSGSGEVSAARLAGVALDGLTEAPDGGWRTDTQGDEGPLLALGDWYDYDLESHRLSPADHTYVVRAGDGSHHALRFLDYYDAHGEAAHPSFRWKPVDPPRGALVHLDHGDGSATLTVDARDEEAWVYVDLPNLRAVDPVTPEDDPSWDLALQRTGILLNGGASGTGQAAVVRFDALPFEALHAAPVEGWLTDVDDGDGGVVGALASWYTYDFVDHVVRPADATWALRTADGQPYALRFDGYYDEGEPGFVSFTLAPLETP